MRRAVLALFLLCTFCIAARAQDETALRARLQQADDLSRLDEPVLKPWHLKATFQIASGADLPKGTGTLEEWWAGPSLYKRTIASRSYTATEIVNKDGRFRTNNSGPPPYLIDLIVQEILHPFPDEKTLVKDTVELSSKPLTKDPLDCIRVYFSDKNPSKPTEKIRLPIATPEYRPTYCLMRDTTNLVVSINYRYQSLIRKRIAKFQGHSITYEFTLNLVTDPAIHATVDTLESAALSDADFTVTPDMDKRPSDLVATDLADTMASHDVIPGKILRRDDPQFSDRMRAYKVSGVAVLDLGIDKNGRIDSLQVVDADFPDVAMQAYDCVRNWRFAPFTLHGNPVAVTDIYVNVNFSYSE